MARKKDTFEPIHPTAIMNALSAYMADVRHMQAVMDNAHRFLTDKELDPKKLCEVVGEQIGEAIERMNKWRNAE
jgi:hypothetical protein